jgi:GT2 family glycosyltransferase/glycosyltransferase involved in cell wall biosynthesis
MPTQDDRDRMIRERDETIAWLRGEIAELKRARQRLEDANQLQYSQLDQIYRSRGWVWLSRARRVKQQLMKWTGLSALRPAPAPGLSQSNGPVAPVPASPGIAARPRISLPDIDPGPVSGAWGTVGLLPAVEILASEAVLARGRTDRERRRADVLCFSIIDWEFRYQRPQQIMSAFAARGHRVFYISTSRFVDGRTATEPRVRMIKDNVYEVELASPRTPDVYGELIDPARYGSLLESIASLRRDYDISAGICYVMIASWMEIAREARHRWHWPVLYDCMDEWENFQGIKSAIVSAEAALVRECDLLVVSAARLLQKWTASGRPIVLARNGVDADFYADRCQPNDRLANTAHPIVGYFGAIATWFDVDLVAHAARARPNYQFVLLGGVFDVDVSELQKLPNVSLLGQQPYETMPQYLFHFDACMIPFKVSPITEATDPVKLYEYLSGGKPVVSVRLPEIATYSDLVHLADSPEEFVAGLDRAIGERDPDSAGRRREFARANTWGTRYDAIAAGLSGISTSASIIIVTHNNLPLTRLCLESVLRNTNSSSYEVIVVDNASTDGTPQYLEALARANPEIRAICNSTNLGFPRGNNVGLSHSEGDILVLLNNDTVVPPGWLERLASHLRNPAIGLVGPMTNFVGNEAKIAVPYRTIGEMEKFAAERARLFEGQVADISMLAMFCVALRHDTFQEVGLLDERFGIGMFEDDDYAHRIRATGRRVVCARDGFVHHVGQAAFKKLIERGEYNALFEQNRKLYQEKWGAAWTPHRHGDLRWETVSTGDGAAR